MQCEFCGFANGDDDHRCLRCGRRTTGRVVAAPMAYSGNNALALDPWMMQDQAQLNETQELPLLRGQAAPPLSNVIPFTEIQRQAGRTPTPMPAAPPPSVSIPPSRPVAPQQRKKSTTSPSAQESLDFTPVAAAPPRVLTGGIPALNYCQRPVATVSHRFFASIVDSAMILIGFVLFVAMVQATGYAMGAPEILGSGRPFLTMMGSFFLIVTGFYGLVWLMAKRETAGMRVAGLELITFDNSPLDPSTRLVRVAATWLSIGAGGLGIIWAIADEEKLTWQDHISKSFPTFREQEVSFVRQNR